MIKDRAGVLVRVPAKMMLFGEYSVLSGGECLAFTLDRHLEVRARLRSDRTFELSSDLWPKALVWKHGSAPSMNKNNGVLLGSLLAASERLGVTGLSLDVRSGWEVKDGLGSSSAVRLGVGAALAALFAPSPSLWPLAKSAYLEQKADQGFASGYDLATQAQGGLISFAFNEDEWPSKLQAHPFTSKFSQFVHVYLGGKGAPTQGLGRGTLTWLKDVCGLERLHELNSSLQKTFLDLMAGGQKHLNPSHFFQTLAQFRHFMAPSPACPKALVDSLAQVAGLDQTWSFKPSGAGGEDALLVFGEPDPIQGVDACLRALGWSPFLGVYPAQGLSIEAL